MRPNGFKAQVVAPSRSAAVKYARKLNDSGLKAYPIITTNADDGNEFKHAQELNQGQIIGDFVDPEGESEVLVVVDMLLTGFDAPVEQVLYLDKSLKDHALLQAIARVNRRFSHRKDGVETEKTYGLVVDYHGVSRNLESVLSTFEWRDVEDSMREWEKKLEELIEAVADQAESHFKGYDLSQPMKCIAVFAPDVHTEGHFKADLFQQFDADYRHFSKLMDRFLPDPRALAYIDRLARLTGIRQSVRAQFLREDADVDWTEIGAKVKQLVDARISAEVREMMKPLSILDEDFEQKIAGVSDAEAQATVIAHSIRARIQERSVEALIFYERLSQRLARIIDDLHNQLIDATEACLRMAQLRDEMQTREQ